MKKVKLALGAFILGQISVMLYKDESVKAKFEKAKGLDKCKVLFHGLIDFNKKFFTDIKEYNYDEKIDEIANYYNSEKTKLEGKISELSDKLGTLNEDKLQPLLKDLEEKYDDFKEKFEDKVEDFEDKIEDLNDRYELDKKLELVKNEVQKGFKAVKAKIDSLKK